MLEYDGSTRTLWDVVGVDGVHAKIKRKKKKARSWFFFWGCMCLVTRRGQVVGSIRSGGVVEPLWCGDRSNEGPFLFLPFPWWKILYFIKCNRKKQLCKVLSTVEYILLMPFHAYLPPLEGQL